MELFEFSKFIGAIYRQSKKDFKHEITELDVRATQSDLLMFIYNHAELTQQQIAQGMTIDPSLLARDIRVLIDKGWVQRAPHANDRRAKVITLTPLGQQLAQRLKEITNKWWSELFAQNPAIDSQVFGQQLELVRQALAVKKS
ncbi:MarR family winged helix-turn-helix transcriptional regulator [Loigolactobacillus jiayinensis]|uniref:MarR family winged helix-turn-helix transcriptional regulator n=1 Tax=Loigolactobacillus jiayinensis TaxID=2486016 RepID=A0ABW1RBY3_9LACO|nr:MarR family transcriptional regulator [Loigolactobacillus jiayinensis]